MTGSEKTQRAWITVAIINHSLEHGLTVPDSDYRGVASASQKLAAGFAQAAEDLPSRFFASKRRHQPLPPPPYLFGAAGLLAMNKDCADVLRRFDLGDGGLHPITLWQSDEVTQIPGEYFLLNFGARKAAFLVDQSPHAREVREIKRWAVNLEAVFPDQSACTLSANALEGADLWCDPLVVRGFFMSDRLVTALRDADLLKLFQVRFCNIAD